MAYYTGNLGTATSFRSSRRDVNLPARSYPKADSDRALPFRTSGFWQIFGSKDTGNRCNAKMWNFF